MVVLVQDRAKHILCPVAEENARRLGVHISPHPVAALQHRFQHRIGVRGLRIQFDQLRAHLVCRAHRSLIQHPAAAAGAFRRQPSAKACALHVSGFQFSVSLQPCQLQRFPSAVLCQHVIGVHSKSAHALRQLHSLVKGVHIFHLSQPVQAAGCSCIPPGISNFCWHVPADGRTCPIRYLPSGQLLLHLPLLCGQALLFKTVSFPHPARLFRRAAFHPFPSVLHGSSAPAQLTFRLCLPVQLFWVKQHRLRIFKVYFLYNFRSVRKTHRHSVVAYTHAVALSAVTLLQLCAALALSLSHRLICRILYSCRFRLRSQGSLTEGAAARRRLKEFTLRLLRLCAALVLYLSHRLLCPHFVLQCLPCPFHLSFVVCPLHITHNAGIAAVRLCKPCAHSTAQGTGCTARQAAFQRR